MRGKLVPQPDLAALARRINREHAQIETAVRSSLEHARTAGDLLLQAQDTCQRQQQPWLAWLKANVPFSDRTARAYMRVSKEWDTLKSATVANLGYREALEFLADQGRQTVHAVITPGPGPPEQAARVVCVDPPANPNAEAEPVQEIQYLRVVTEPPVPERLQTLPQVSAEERPSHEPGDYVTLDAWNKMSDAKRRKTLAATAGDKRFIGQGDNENIEWALWSWNPVTGCLHNCPYCYARDIAKRFYEQEFEPSLWPSRLAAPRNTIFPEGKITAALAEDSGLGRVKALGLKNVFVCSMADLFGRWVPAEWIEAVLDEVRAAPQWNFLFLTKFPIRMAEFDFPDNAWVGTTVDCQARVANAEKAFRKVKAGVKWLSCEPLIERLKFKDLGAFDWVVLGGASASMQTPEWHPPRAWVVEIEAEAERLGVPWYEKANLLSRTRKYPGVEIPEPSQAPESLRYLPEVGA